MYNGPLVPHAVSPVYAIRHNPIVASLLLNLGILIPQKSIIHILSSIKPFSRKQFKLKLKAKIKLFLPLILQNCPIIGCY
jgi:hypothetical protein